MGECGGGYVRREPGECVLYQAVREGWPEVLAEADARGGLPKYVHEEVRRYLECGDPRYGLALVKCQSCRESMVVAFSCKTRGWCPSCGTRRAYETGAHCNRVLPRVAYRQWTLSLPGALRWKAVKVPKLMRALERRLVRAVWRWQRQGARRAGVRGDFTGGAVGFTQYFGSALQLTPHLHVLVPEALWGPDGLETVGEPTDQDVEAILRRTLKQVLKEFRDLDVEWGDDGLDALRAQAAQHRLRLGDAVRPKGRKVAVVEGFSLHADTWVHANDRTGLARLCRYGARGPIAKERLSRADDGTFEYRTKRGVTLRLTAAALVRRLIALIPPAGYHLTCFHGAFAANSRRRAEAILQAPIEEPEPKKTLSLKAATTKPRRPRMDFATLQQRTFGVDVWTCRCGGKRKVMAIVTSHRTAAQLLENLGLTPKPRSAPPRGPSPPQLSLSI